MNLYSGKEFGARLRQVRRDKGMTQAQVCEAAGWSGTARVSQIEKGTGNGVTQETAQRLAEALSVAVQTLTAGVPVTRKRTRYDAAAESGKGAQASTVTPLRPKTGTHPVIQHGNSLILDLSQLPPAGVQLVRMAVDYAADPSITPGVHGAMMRLCRELAQIALIDD